MIVTIVLLLLVSPASMFVGLAISRAAGERAGWSAGYMAGLDAGAAMERNAICRAVNDGHQLARLAGRADRIGVN
jgi:hypothetical protein